MCFSEKLQYKLIIFDLDGTVLDTIADLCNSVNYALKLHNLPERTLDEVRNFVGNGIRRLIELSVPENTKLSVTDSVFASFKEHYKEHSKDNTKPYDGITELLVELKNNGFLTALVSNKADFAVKNLIDEYFCGLFSYAAGEKEGIPRKPAPDMVHNAIGFFGVSPGETVYIGDSEVDIKTAENSGIDSIIVTWGFRDEKALRNAGAEVLVNDTESLRNMLCPSDETS